LFGEVHVPAGTYTLFALLNENEWTLILNSVLGQWGAYAYEENKNKDLAKVTVPIKTIENVVEQLTIRFDGANTMHIEWDKTQVQVPIMQAEKQ